MGFLAILPPDAWKKGIFMKRLLALILVLAMIFAFASCTLFGGDNGGDDDQSEDGGDNGGTTGINPPFSGDGIDLPLVDIEPD